MTADIYEIVTKTRKELQHELLARGYRVTEKNVEILVQVYRDFYSHFTQEESNDFWNFLEDTQHLHDKLWKEE